MQVVDDVRRKQLIANILSTSSLLEAFKKTKISPPTGYAWLSEPEFQAELKQANQKIFNTTLTRLSGLSESAYEALSESLKSANENVRLKAAALYFQTMLNPKTTINDMESAEQKDHIDRIYAAIKELPKESQKILLEAYQGKTG